MVAEKSPLQEKDINQRLRVPRGKSVQPVAEGHSLSTEGKIPPDPTKVSVCARAVTNH